MILLLDDVIIAYFGWLLGSMVAILRQAMRCMDEQPAHWMWTVCYGVGSDIDPVILTLD
jgi:hypothetical protein